MPDPGELWNSIIPTIMVFLIIHPFYVFTHSFIIWLVLNACYGPYKVQDPKDAKIKYNLQEGKRTHEHNVSTLVSRVLWFKTKECVEVPVRERLILIWRKILKSSIEKGMLGWVWKMRWARLPCSDDRVFHVKEDMGITTAGNTEALQQPIGLHWHQFSHVLDKTA